MVNCVVCELLFVVQFLSHVWLFATPWTSACQASLSFTVSQSLFKCMSIESVMLSNYLILCHPLHLLPSIFPSIGSFPMSQLFESCGQSIGASASASVLPMIIQGLFPLRRAWKTTPVFLPGEFHRQKSLVGYSPWDCKESHDWVTNGISFRIDWFYLLAVQGTLMILLQHNSKASILRCSAFIMVELSHPYMATGKTSFDYMDLCWQSDVSAF